METILASSPGAGLLDQPVEVQIVENWRGGFSLVVVGSAQPQFGNYATREDARRIAALNDYTVVD